MPNLACVKAHFKNNNYALMVYCKCESATIKYTTAENNNKNLLI